MKIQFNLNGLQKQVDVPPLKTALDVLRENFQLIGAKKGCGKGECGACTILLNGKTVTSCLIPAVQLSGKSVYTIEGVQKFPIFKDIQGAFEDAGAVQCGFCIPGFVMSTVGFLINRENFEEIRDDEIKIALSGNLCRCTGYKKIIEAVRILIDDRISGRGSNWQNLRKGALTSEGVGNSVRGRPGEGVIGQPDDLKQLKSLIDSYKNRKIKFIAGGTDLMVRDDNFSSDDQIIDLSNMKELSEIRQNENKISVGSAVSFSRIVNDKLISDNYPILIDALETIGSPQIRHRATLGGNIANASPAGDSIPPLMVLEAEIVLNNPILSEIRIVNIEQFFVGPGKTILKNGEFIQSIEIPSPQFGNSVHYFRKVGQRKSLAISKTSLAILSKIKSDKIGNIKIASGSVAPTVIRLKKTEKFLFGKKITVQNIAKAKEILRTEIFPIADIRSTADYRREITANLLDEFLMSWTDADETNF